MVSEDLDELMTVCDRILVMHDGHISGDVIAGAFDRQSIGQLMIGGRGMTTTLTRDVERRPTTPSRLPRPMLPGRRPLGRWRCSPPS